MSNEIDIKIWAGVLAMVVSGCGGTPEDPGSFGEPPRSVEAKLPEGKPGPILKETPPLDYYKPLPQVMTWTSSGDVAVIDGATGKIRSLTPTSGVSGQPDLIYDQWESQAVVFEYDDRDQSGEIASYQAVWGPGGVTLGPRLHELWVDGEARLLPAPIGYVIFEGSYYGDNWKVLFDDQETTSSLAEPTPASAWVTTPNGYDFSVHAMVYSDIGPMFRMTSDGVWHTLGAPAVSSLGVGPAGNPPTARLMNAPALGDAALFDVIGSELAVSLVNGPTVLPADTAPLGQDGLRIEHAAALDGGEVALLLISGDSRVMAVEINPNGTIKSTDSLPLPGTVRQETRFFSHDLAVLGQHHALAATSDGVFSIHLTRGGDGVHLAFDAGFSGPTLRGPIAPLAAYSP